MIYFFDFGHGGSDPGAVYRGNGQTLNEKDIVYQIGVKTTNRMRELGATVKLTRKGDEYLTLYERKNKSNKEMGSNGLFVSFHTNSFKESRANGVETFYFAGSNNGKRAATKVQNELKKVFKTDRGVKTARFYVLRKTDAPAILMELGFISNAEDRKVMLTRQDEIVEAIVRGLCAYEGRKYIPKTKKPVKKPQIKIDVFGEIVEVDGYIKNGVSYLEFDSKRVPIKRFFEGLGFRVGWDNKNRIVTINKEG